ncbi:hypothetical protein JW935_03880 [candidate division KSB1 bacterium]|nr:hypothetical protein [candidate division KSB1 bacterium]
MKSKNQKRPGKRILHFLNEDGMVACNPRDREAAHRAQVEGIATENVNAVTCKKCWVVIRRIRKN